MYNRHQDPTNNQARCINKLLKRLNDSSLWETHHRATKHHLSYGITQCYLSPDTGERAPPNPSQKAWYSIYLPWRDGRPSWARWLVTYQHSEDWCSTGHD